MARRERLKSGPSWVVLRLAGPVVDRLFGEAGDSDPARIRALMASPDPSDWGEAHHELSEVWATFGLLCGACGFLFALLAAFTGLPGALVAGAVAVIPTTPCVVEWSVHTLQARAPRHDNRVAKATAALGRLMWPADLAAALGLVGFLLVETFVH